MAFLHLHSSNPQFSWALYKNPDTGLIASSHKDGQLLGWYPPEADGWDENAYCVYFTEPSLGQSYDNERSHISPLRFESPLFLVDAIKEFFWHLVGGDVDKDVVAKQRLVVEQIHVAHDRYADFFDAFVDWADITYEDKRLVIEAETTLDRLLSLASLFGLLSASYNWGSDVWGHESRIRAYVDIIQRLELPYYLRSLFAAQLMRSSKMFDTFSDELAKNAPQDIQFTQYSLHKDRIYFAKKEIDWSRTVVDLGCGEGKYTHIAAQVDTYIGIDPNDDVRAKAEAYARRKEYDGCSFYSSIYDAPIPPDTNIICSEVIEHMDVHSARGLLDAALGTRPKTLIVTTPNSDFNQFYQLEGMRHDDHVFEMDSERFQEFIQEVLRRTNYQPVDDAPQYDVRFEGIGDQVNGIHPTQAAVFTAT